MHNLSILIHLDMEINNVLISDGKQFYDNSEITKSNKLMNCYRSVMVFHPFASLIDRINKENALLIIHVSPDLQDILRTEINQASKELAYEFYCKYLN